MKTVLRGLCFVFGLLAISSFSQATYSGYTYRRTFTIDHTKVSSTLTDFPVLSSTTLVYASTATGSGGRLTGSGYDLVWSTNSDCSFTLNWDTQTVNATGTGVRLEWVKVPSISSSIDTVIYQCYGNSSITTYQGNSKNAWDSSFVSVFHLEEGSGGVFGATTEVSSGTAIGSPSYSSQGQIGKAITFDGSSSGFNLSDPSVFSFERTSSFTITMWTTPNITRSGATTENVLFSKLQGSAPFPGYEPSLIWNDAGLFPNETRLQLYLINTYPSNCLRVYSSTDISDSMHYIALTYSGTSHATGTVFYLDGTSDVLNVFPSVCNDTLSASIISAADPSIAVRGSGPSTYYPGLIDEVRVSNVARSAAWVGAEYASQSAPSTFAALGSETTSGVVAPSNITGLSINGGRVTIH